MSKKWKHNVLAVVLGVAACATMFGACSNQDNQVPVSLPTYSSDRELDLLAYVNPTNGDCTVNGIPSNYGKDFRTVEYYKDYMAAGFNIAFARYDSALPADATKDTWQDTGTKLVCDVAYEAGLRKILITDLYFDELIRYSSGKLIGSNEEDRYATQEEMDADIAERLSIYKDVPGFYGVIMIDEPKYPDFDNYALVAKSVKRALPDVFLYHNLFYGFESGISYYTDVEAWQEEYGQKPTLTEAFNDYLCSFLEKTGAKNLAIDIYPFCDLPEERVKEFFSNIQILRNACDAYGAELSFTFQSISYIKNGEVNKRTVNRSDLWMQMNTLLGFGATSLQYYTYFPHPSNDSSYNVGNMIDRKGNKTNVYYDAKAVNEAVRKFDEILLHYDFQGAKMYFASTIRNGAADNYLGATMRFDNTFNPKLLTSFTQDNDAMLVTELKDEENDLYMYMVMNAIDSLFAQYGGMVNTECTFTAEFKGYDYVAELDCGELRYVKLHNGKYTKSLSSGYAVYLIPLKVQ